MTRKSIPSFINIRVGGRMGEGGGVAVKLGFYCYNFHIVLHPGYNQITVVTVVIIVGKRNYNDL